VGDLKRSDPVIKDKAIALRKRAGTGRTGDRAGGSGRSKQDVYDWSSKSPLSE